MALATAISQTMVSCSAYLDGKPAERLTSCSQLGEL